MVCVELWQARIARLTALAAIAVAGVMSIVGSGGGDLWACFDGGPGCFNGGPYPPSADVDPRRITVQVGSPVTFSVRVYGYKLPRAYKLQWCEQPKGGAACIPIAGATEDTYTLASANLGDDGAQFQVMVDDANGTAQASSMLAVSSTAGVSFTDGNFAPPDWAVSAVVTPELGGTTYSQVRSAAGGNADAYLSVTYLLPAAPGSVRLFQAANAALYDPAVQGAVYVIDFALDCVKLSFTGVIAEAMPMIEQGARRYVPVEATYDAGTLCADPAWRGFSASSVSASEFALADGPACGASETCPDFSNTGAPIRLGFATSVSVQASQSTDPVVQGIDNWKATVWPR